MLTLYRIINWIFNIFSLMLLAYVILSFVRPRPNRFTMLLNRIVDTVLDPVRRLLRAKLPPAAQILDWSPLVVWLLMRIVRMILRMFIFPAAVWL